MADQKVDPQKAALLAAMARSGSAAQQAAIGAANARADQIQAPVGFYAQQAAQIAEPYQTADRDAAAAAAAFKNYQSGLGSIAGDYQARVKAALPIVNQIAQGEVARTQVEDPFKKQQQQWAIEDRNYAMKDRDLQNKAQSAYDRQQSMLRNINQSSALNQDAKDTFNQIIATSGDDYATALQTYAATLEASKKDSKKLATVKAIQPYIAQYFDPSGGDNLVFAKEAAVRTQPTKSKTTSTKKGYSPSVLEQINRTINPITRQAQGLFNFNRRR